MYKTVTFTDKLEHMSKECVNRLSISVTRGIYVPVIFSHLIWNMGTFWPEVFYVESMLSGEVCATDRTNYSENASSSEIFVVILFPRSRPVYLVDS